MATAISRLAAEIDIRDVLPAISVPTLIVHRRGDMSWPIDGARYMAERIPGRGSSSSRAPTTSPSPGTSTR